MHLQRWLCKSDGNIHQPVKYSVVGSSIEKIKMSIKCHTRVDEILKSGEGSNDDWHKRRWSAQSTDGHSPKQLNGGICINRSTRWSWDQCMLRTARNNSDWKLVFSRTPPWKTKRVVNSVFFFSSEFTILIIQWILSFSSVHFSGIHATAKKKKIQ